MSEHQNHSTGGIPFLYATSPPPIKFSTTCKRAREFALNATFNKENNTTQSHSVHHVFARNHVIMFPRVPLHLDDGGF